MIGIPSVVRQTLALTGRELKHWYRSRMQIAMDELVEHDFVPKTYLH